MSITDVKIETILFATDLSEDSRIAFAYAVSLSKKYDARVILLHAMQEPSEKAVHLIGDKQWSNYRKRRSESAKETLTGKRLDLLSARKKMDDYLDHLCGDNQEIKPEYDDIVLESGKPVEVIMDVSQTYSCDLIIMGAHDESGLVSSMFGSTVIHVLRKTRIPVLVVKIDDPQT